MASPNRTDLRGDRFGHLPWRQNVTTVSTFTTAVRELTEKDSGTFFTIGRATSAMFVLPRISSLALGLTYEFLFAQQADANDGQISCTNDSSAAISGIYTSGSTDDTAVVARPLSTQTPEYCRVVALSSVRWQLIPGYGRETTGNETMDVVSKGVWVAGSNNPS